MRTTLWRRALRRPRDRAGRSPRHRGPAAVDAAGPWLRAGARPTGV